MWVITIMKATVSSYYYNNNNKLFRIYKMFVRLKYLPYYRVLCCPTVDYNRYLDLCKFSLVCVDFHDHNSCEPFPALIVEC